MNFENKDNIKRRRIRRIIFIALACLLVCVILLSFFVFRFVFPSDKDLLIVANYNTLKKMYSDEKPECFTKQTDISLKTTGDFTSQKTADAISTFRMSLGNSQKNNAECKYDVLIEFLGEELLCSEVIKKEETEVLTIPQLADKSYGADSYSDVLSLLLGSEKAQEIDVFDGIDKKEFEKYCGKYLKKLYRNLPDKDFSVTETSGIKTVVLETDLNRLLYDVLLDIKNDTLFCNYVYEQKKIIYQNLNKKIPYLGTLFVIEEEEEFNEEFLRSVEELIDNFEDSTLKIAAQIDNKMMLKESVEVRKQDEIQFLVEYTDNEIKILNTDDGRKKFEFITEVGVSGNISNRKSVLTLDVNDMTKEKSSEQKLVTITAETLLENDSAKEIELPEKFSDIRHMSEEEKNEVTQTASEKFMEMLTFLTLHLIL